MYFANDRPIIAAATPPDRLAVGQGVSFSGLGVGTALGVLVGGALGELMPWRQVFLVLMALPLCSADPDRPLRARSRQERPGFARGARVPRRGRGRLPAARPVAPRASPASRRSGPSGSSGPGGRPCSPRSGSASSGRIGRLRERPRDRRAARPPRRGRAVRPPAAARGTPRRTVVAGMIAATAVLAACVGVDRPGARARLAPRRRRLRHELLLLGDVGAGLRAHGRARPAAGDGRRLRGPERRRVHRELSSPRSSRAGSRTGPAPSPGGATWRAPRHRGRAGRARRGLPSSRSALTRRLNGRSAVASPPALARLGSRDRLYTGAVSRPGRLAGLLVAPLVGLACSVGGAQEVRRGDARQRPARAPPGGPPEPGRQLPGLVPGRARGTSGSG